MFEPEELMARIVDLEEQLKVSEMAPPAAEQLIACLEGEIAKRDEELAACRVAVENCELFRARIAELEARIVWIECEAQVNAAPVSEAKAQGEYGDAYQGAREDLAIWRRRALEAEEKVRHQEQIIDRMGEDLNAINGPTFMGEPVIRDTVEVSRKAIQRLFKAAGCSGSVGNSEVLNAASDRLKAAPVQQVSVQDGFCIGAWRDALEKIAKYAPQVNCEARTELERAGLIAVHALIAFSAPQFRHARGTQTASNAAPAAPAADAGHVFYGMDGNHP